MSVSELDVASFHRVRPQLFGVAYRVLGSRTEADDVVQDTWVRWHGADRSQVRDAAAFLSTTTMRLAINVGQSARACRESSLEARLVEPVDIGADPSHAVEQREALERVVRTLLEKLSATERAVFVLREAFDYPYRQAGEVIGLSEVNARQLATRARRRLCGEHRRPVGSAEHRRLLDAFVAAAQNGDLATLEELLVNDVTGYGEIRVAA